MLLIKGNGKKRSKGKIPAAEKIIAVISEVLFRLFQIIMMKKGWFGGNVKILHKTWIKEIDHFFLEKNKILPESM